ncbi:hypothetical protein MADP12_00591 [Mycoplasma anatis]|uniref:SLAC1 family transporter n=2 Tax=Mycoplasmopsis anatis TaxID=171279 RepID=UPI001C4EED04|nr:hypothetical protein [Mycoplasmopsis anatis]MBW0599950.1 hypothetical protein [Mycoplasmopsis anatis]
MKHQYLSQMPLSLCGYALGISGLGGALIYFINEFKNSTNSQTLLTIQTIIYTLLILYSFAIWIIVLLRFWYCFELLKSELKTPNKSGFIAATFMCMCQFSGYIGWMFTNYILDDFSLKYYLFLIPNTIMLISLLLHLTFLFYFFKHIFLPHNYRDDEIYASWFIALIGMVISVTCFNNLGNLIPVFFFQILWLFGLSIYLWVWPVVLYKFLFLPHKDENDKPSMGIIASPANLLCTGYLDVFNPGNKFTSILNNAIFYKFLGMFMLFFVATSIIIMFAVLVYSLKKHKFIILFTSFSFPSGIAATSILKFSQNYFVASGELVAIHYLFFVLGTILLLISLIVIICLNVPHLRIIIDVLKQRNNFIKKLNKQVQI